MSLSNNPKFPIYSWKVDLSGEVLEADDGGGWVNVTLPTTTAWGYFTSSRSSAELGTDTTAVSTWGKLRDALDTAFSSSLPAPDFLTSNTNVAVRAYIDTTGVLGAGSQLRGPTDIMRALGFFGTPSAGKITVDVTDVGGGSYRFQSNGNIAGCLSFNADAKEMNRNRIFLATREENAIAPGTVSVYDYAEREVCNDVMRSVFGRYLTADYASDALYAAQANTDVTDTNGTIESMLRASVQQRDMRRWVDHADGDGVQLLWQSNPSVMDFAAAGSPGGRRFTVTIPTVIT